MEDVIRDFPPPSRLFFDDLNNFSSLPHPLPSPFLLLSNPNAEPSSPLEPSLLIVAVSRLSTFLLHHLRRRALVGTLVLSEFSVVANFLDSSSLPFEKGKNNTSGKGLQPSGGEALDVSLEEASRAAVQAVQLCSSEAGQGISELTASKNSELPSRRSRNYKRKP
ncbi:hypothetical protein EJ110_NYTH18523 [Nymphaea thermarum]|nr:hypothetical protein EJ110_NYTH18523 [Nymphaea thermarum]